MSADPWPLVVEKDDGIRPAGPPDACFYCAQKVGQLHARDCVMVVKVVRFRCTIEVDLTVPHSWTREEIRSFHGRQFYDEVWSTIFETDHRVDHPEVYRCEFVGVVDEIPRREVQKPETSQAE